MHVGDVIVFGMPRAEVRAGEVLEFTEDGMTEMPVVEDHEGREYPVHPENVEDVNHIAG